jgi:hypothetical protein
MSALFEVCAILVSHSEHQPKLQYSVPWGKRGNPNTGLNSLSSGVLSEASDEAEAYKMAEQTERAFQKQPTVFLNDKFHTMGLGKKPKKKDRYVKNVGLGFKTPREV